MRSRPHCSSAMSLFRPKEILDRYDDFDMKSYYDKGYRTIFLDIDNTIAIPNTGKCDDNARRFIEELKDMGYEVLIFSNNTYMRVRSFAEPIECRWQCWSMKPLPFGFWIAAVKLKVKPSKVVALGDQLLTDILGANLSGCYGIYCKQLQEKDSPLTKMNRRIEKLIWRYILHEEM